MFFIISLYAIWSSVFALGKLLLAHCPPLFLTASRMLLASMIIFIYLAIRKSSFAIPHKKWLPLFFYAILGIYLTNALEFWSLKHLSSSKVCFLYSLSPFFAALLSYFHFGEKMTPRKWAGMAIGFLGILPSLSLSSEILFFSWPELAMVGTVLCSSYGWILLRSLVQGDRGLSPLTVNFIAMFIGGLMALAHSRWTDPWTPTPVSSFQILPFLGGTLLITLISNVLCYSLYGHMLKRFTATFLSFAGLLSPIFASIHGWVLLGETPSLTIIFSTGILAFGLWLVYSAELRQGYVVAQKPQSSFAK